MTPSNESINSHIEEYLNYYCGLSHAPEFAVLLKGQWGSGKTWFINKYCKKLKANNQRCLYVSLYGMTAFSEIEDAFFQQLHPVLSSKGMAITGKIFRGLLKGTLKIDLDNDNKADGTLNIQIPEIQIPEINLPDYLKDADKSILIFDDLERCKMDISNILGYINYFVEHQGLKVVIIANEDELLKQGSYKAIKEKLIGKTLNVSLDFDGALENFITVVNNSVVRELLTKNTELIKDLYNQAEYENLRNLKQIVLDFERIFEVLPEKAKNESELLQDILKLLMTFSIEIKRGEMLPKEISKLHEEYISGVSKRVIFQTPNSVTNTKETHEEPTSLQKILSRYPRLALHEPFPSQVWWETFFDKGILDTQELEQSLSTSKYFQDENTPHWVRLWHYSDLDDDEFENLLKKVESEYANRQFLQLGEIKHIVGLFLMFSDIGLFDKSKKEILKDSKTYIDDLKKSNQLDISIVNQEDFLESITRSYRSLGFQGKEFTEFTEFCSYLNEVRELARTDNFPLAGQELLAIMQNDVWKFYKMICLNDSLNWDKDSQKYYKIPILKYTKESDFVEKILNMKIRDRQCVFWALKKRYEYDDINNNLIKELEWIKSVQQLLLDKALQKKGKISGHILEFDTKYYLDKVIKKLEELTIKSKIIK